MADLQRDGSQRGEEAAPAESVPAGNVPTGDVPTATREAPGREVAPAESESASGDEHGRRVKGIFSEIARQYDLFNALSSFGIYKSWLRAVARTVACTGEDVMLDVAGGTGDVAFTICDACPPASVELTDFTPEMLDVARERILAGANMGVPVTLNVVDAQDLPYEDGSFTLVTCAYGLRNFTDRHRAMREAARVLKPGGRYVALEFATPPNAVWRVLYRFYLQHMIPFIGGLVTGDRSGFEYLRDSIRAFPPQDAIARELREAGFSQVGYENRTGGIVAIYRAVK